MSLSEPERQLSLSPAIPPLDDIPRGRPSLKRSASLASLPTPPRTRRRHGGRSRGGDSESSSSEEEHIGTDDEEEKRGRYKRRKVQEEREEDEFWGAVSGNKSQENVRQRERGRPLVYRRLQAQKPPTTNEAKSAAAATAPVPQATAKIVAPFSPPPSHRKPAPVPAPKLPEPELKTPSPPSTPKKKSLPSKSDPLFALRDSPDNPFLDTPENVPETDVSPSASEESPGGPKTPTADVEKPFITYVFRGTRRTYANPYFNPRTGRAYSPPPNTRLPPDHPDFEPDERCGPRVLFPKKGLRKGREKTPTPELNDDSDDEQITPRKLDFGAAKGRRLVTKTRARPSSLEQGNMTTRKRVRTLLEEMAEAQEED